MTTDRQRVERTALKVILIGYLFMGVMLFPITHAIGNGIIDGLLVMAVAIGGVLAIAHGPFHIALWLCGDDQNA